MCAPPEKGIKREKTLLVTPGCGLVWHYYVCHLVIPYNKKVIIQTIEGRTSFTLF